MGCAIYEPENLLVIPGEFNNAVLWTGVLFLMFMFYFFIFLFFYRCSIRGDCERGWM